MKRSNQFVVAAVIGSALSLTCAYGLAQGKPTAPQKQPVASAGVDAGLRQACPHDECKHGCMSCPMSSLSALAELKVERTKTGASLHMMAKDPSKLTEVQALVEKLAEHMKACECPMMKDGVGHPGGHHHGHMPAK